MRQDMMATMKAGVSDGRLSEALARVTEKRKAMMQVKTAEGIEACAVTTQPIRPTSSKNAVRPRRHASLSKTTDAVATPMSASTAKVGVAALGTADLFTNTGSMMLASLDRPSSPAGALAPVIPPCRKSTGFSSAGPPAIVFDLAVETTTGCRKPTASTPRSRSSPSAHCSLERSSHHKTSASAMMLDLGYGARPQSRGALNTKQGTTERKLTKLPPLASKSSPFKLPGHGSMDSFVWGTAPVSTSNRLEWVH